MILCKRSFLMQERRSYGDGQGVDRPAAGRLSEAGGFDRGERTAEAVDQGVDRAGDGGRADHAPGIREAFAGRVQQRQHAQRDQPEATDGECGEVQIEVPRDRKASFAAQIVPKGETRWDGFDDKILSMYARGMTTREIQGYLQQMYGVEVSPALISNVTDAVIEEVRAWQSRPLDAVYPIVYLDALVVKMRSDGRVENRAVYVAIGITLAGMKEVLGLWTSANEGAKFWLQVLTERKNRGLKDIFIACVDGLKGFPEAIASERVNDIETGGARV